MIERICPKCKKNYKTIPARSRMDDRLICPDCGIRESLAYIGVKPDEVEHIIELVHRYTENKEDCHEESIT